MSVQLYIDGGNFYHLALKPLNIQNNQFNFDAFAEFLADGRDLAQLGKRYYIGTVREKTGDERSKYAMSQQMRLFNKLKQTQWQIKTSKLRERTEKIIVDSRILDFEKIREAGINEISYTTFREKGIDVKIATDMVVAALDDKCETIIVVSSDTDLVPMLDIIRFRFKKRIEYIGFSIPDSTGKGNYTKPTKSLIDRSDVQRVLIESDIKKFILPEQLPMTK